MTEQLKEEWIFKGLKWSMLLVLGSQAWIHFSGHTVYSSILWDEEGIAWVASDWDTFVNQIFNDRLLDIISYSIGLYFMIVMVQTLRLNKEKEVRNFNQLCFLTTLILALIAFLGARDKFMEWAQFFELSIQFLTPIILAVYLFGKKKQHLILLMKVAIALTFACHGLYALGIFPLPVHFMEMTMGILPLDDTNARLFLKMAGIMDWIVAIMIFIPNRNIVQSALIYMILWGSITALARMTYALLNYGSITDIIQSIPNTLIRVPHALIPFVLLLLLGILNPLPKSHPN